MTDFRMLLCMTRTFDNYHIKSNLIHLISSMFYTEKELNLSNLENIKLFCDIDLVLHVVQNSIVIGNNITQIDKKLFVYKISLDDFICYSVSYITYFFGN